MRENGSISSPSSRDSAVPAGARAPAGRPNGSLVTMDGASGARQAPGAGQPERGDRAATPLPLCNSLGLQSHAPRRSPAAAPGFRRPRWARRPEARSRPSPGPPTTRARRLPRRSGPGPRRPSESGLRLGRTGRPELGRGLIRVPRPLRAHPGRSAMPGPPAGPEEE